jgi:hypothetical protein
MPNKGVHTNTSKNKLTGNFISSLSAVISQLRSLREINIYIPKI